MSKFLVRACLALSASMFVAGCGMGVDATTPPDDSASDSSALNIKCTGASIVVSPLPISYGQTVSIQFYPGSCADTSLYPDLKCYQNGVLVAAGGGCVMQKTTTYCGYTWVTDHYEGITYGLSSPAYTGGAADCTISADVYRRNGNLIPVFSSSFHVDP